MSTNYDLVVIGAGPGGYVAAIRAAQLGLSVACIEKEKTLGGTCLNVGCIPSKALLESSEKYAELRHGLGQHGINVENVGLDLSAMLKRKSKIVTQLTTGIAGLFRKNKVQHLKGLGRFKSPHEIEVVDADGQATVVEAKHVIIATGSVPASLPGIELDGDRIGTSTEALSYAEVPKHLIVVGAGVIGLELGSVWARLGAKVSVLEFNATLLPNFDPEIAKVAQKAFTKQGLEFSFGAKVTGVEKVNGGSEVRVSYVDNGGQTQTLQGDRLLMAVGRKANTEGLELQNAGLAVDARGRIDVDDHLRTKVSHIYAIGDVIRGSMLAHKAEEEGVAAVETICGQHGHVNYDAIPNVVYTEPEIASVGRTETELSQAGIAFKKGSFPFLANGRAKALDQSDGLVKIVADAHSDRILGAQIIGPRASELIAELAVAMEFSASAEDIARCVHAHPTLSEAVKEAALAVADRAIHI
jgi:dihydrolipoamide dehydrogenase